MPKILQISDLHILPDSNDTLLGVNTEYYFRRVLETAHAEQGPFDLILVTGDLAQDPCPASYRRVLERLQNWRTTTLCLPGNHDDLELMQKILNNGVVSCRKHITLKNWQIICLNSQKPGSPAGTLSAEELAFLENCLATEAKLPTLIAVHHHCLPTGCEWLDTMQIENSALLLDLLDRNPRVKVLTYGHVHKQISTAYGHTGLFSAPSTCFQFELNSTEFSVEDRPPGYRVFDLAEDGSYETACYYLKEALQGLVKDIHSY